MSEYLEYQVDFACPKCDHVNHEHIEFEMANRETFVVADTRSARCFKCDTIIELKPSLTIEIDAGVEHECVDESEDDEEYD